MVGCLPFNPPMKLKPLFLIKVLTVLELPFKNPYQPLSLAQGLEQSP